MSARKKPRSRGDWSWKPTESAEQFREAVEASQSAPYASVRDCADFASNVLAGGAGLLGASAVVVPPGRRVDFRRALQRRRP